MRCGSGRRALTRGGGRAEPAVFGGWGARRFFVDIWGLAESLVPAYTNSSIFCEKLRSGDAGERDSVSGERRSSSGVSGDVLSWLPRLFSGERDSVSGERGSSSGVSGDVLSWLPRLFSGERDSVCGERGSSSGVSGDVLSWLPRLFSRKSSLGAESWSCCNTSQSACDELCGQGSAGMSMSSACFGCVALSVSL